MKKKLFSLVDMIELVLDHINTDAPKESDLPEKILFGIYEGDEDVEKLQTMALERLGGMVVVPSFVEDELSLYLDRIDGGKPYLVTIQKYTSENELRDSIQDKVRDILSLKEFYKPIIVVATEGWFFRNFQKKKTKKTERRIFK